MNSELIRLEAELNRRFRDKKAPIEDIIEISQMIAKLAAEEFVKFA